MKDRAKALADLGNDIRAIRKEKGYTLEDVTEVTKIRTNFLEDIENGVLDQFPGSVYVRGFIKSYLHFLGAEELWPQFKPYIFSEEVVGTPDLVLGTCTPPARGFKPVSRLWMIVVLLMIIAGFGWYGWSVWTGRDKPYQEASTVVLPDEKLIATVEEKISEPSSGMEKDLSAIVSEDENISVKELPVSDAASDDERADNIVMTVVSDEIKPEKSLSAIPVNNTLPVAQKDTGSAVSNVLVLSTTRDCWVKLSGPQKTVFQGIIKGNVSREFEITEKTEVVYGRPGSISVSFRGEDLGKPGKGGSVARWFYSPDGTKGRVEN